MTLPEKLLTAVATIVTVLIGGYVFASWWTNRVPGRPRGVRPDAVFLWAPYVGLPAPRRGSWISCEEVSGRDRCTLSGISGKTEYEGEFISDKGKGTLPSDQLEIDADKTREHKVWVGTALVPLVFLKNGKVLIPASEYEEGMRLLKQRRQ